MVPCNYINSVENTEILDADNIREKSLKWIWHNSRVFNDFRHISKKISGKCRSCNLLAKCRGGCRAAAFAATGDLYAADPHCSYVFKR
jgi:radical SAM protein with 4Fe4S-binding SPASM domain